MYPDIGLPVVSLQLLFLLLCFRIITIVMIHLAGWFHISFVDSNYDHFVVLHTCLEDIVKGKYLAFLRDLDKAQARLT